MSIKLADISDEEAWKIVKSYDGTEAAYHGTYEDFLESRKRLKEEFRVHA